MGFDLDRNGNIILTRGDSFKVPLFINKGTDLCPIRKYLSEYDTIYFAVMEPNQPFENAIIKKVYTKDNVNQNGDVEIGLEYFDTECLLPGKYFYQIKGKLIKLDPNTHEPLDNTKPENYVVNTIVQKTEFIIVE